MARRGSKIADRLSRFRGRSSATVGLVGLPSFTQPCSAAMSWQSGQTSTNSCPSGEYRPCARPRAGFARRLQVVVAMLRVWRTAADYSAHLCDRIASLSYCVLHCKSPKGSVRRRRNSPRGARCPPQGRPRPLEGQGSAGAFQRAGRAPVSTRRSRSRLRAPRALPQLMPGERIDMGNLYRILRSLEREGLVSSTWDDAPPDRPSAFTRSRTPAARSSTSGSEPSARRSSRSKLSSDGTNSRGVNMHHRRRRHGGPGVGHRWYEPERVLERLENYQRDLEQELADVADPSASSSERRPRRSNRTRARGRGSNLGLFPFLLVSSISFCATWVGTSS